MYLAAGYRDSTLWMDRGRFQRWISLLIRTLWADLVWSRRPRNMGQSCFRRGERLALEAPLLRRQIVCPYETESMTYSRGPAQ